MSTLSTRRLAAMATLCGLPLLTSVEAPAQPGKLEAGTLTCKGKGTVGLVVGSKETLSCAFVPTGKGAKQSYTATITKIGLDVGVKGANTVVWTVLYSSSAVPGGALAGNYVGASADASVGVGGGANVLVGGSKNSVSLQPLSVQGQTGLNLAVGVSGLTLTQNP